MTRWPALEPTTRARYEQVWRTHIERPLGSCRIGSITREQVHLYVARLSAGGIAPGTVRKAHAVLGAILNEAVELGYIKVNPAIGVKGIPRAQQREMLFLTGEEVQTLAEAIAPSTDTASSSTRRRHGPSRGGIGPAFRWRNVDLVDRRLTVAEALKETDGGLMFGPPKTHQRRTLALPRFLCKMLEAHLAAVPVSAPQDRLVFCAPQGGPMRHHLFYRRHFKPAVRCALPHKAMLRFHDLRHTCASLLIAQGAHPKLIQARLGHSSIQVTLDPMDTCSPRLRLHLPTSSTRHSRQHPPLNR